MYNVTNKIKIQAQQAYNGWETETHEIVLIAFKQYVLGITDPSMIWIH